MLPIYIFFFIFFNYNYYLLLVHRKIMNSFIYTYTYTWAKRHSIEKQMFFSSMRSCSFIFIELRSCDEDGGSCFVMCVVYVCIWTRALKNALCVWCLPLYLFSFAHFKKFAQRKRKLVGCLMFDV